MRIAGDTCGNRDLGNDLIRAKDRNQMLQHERTDQNPHRGMRNLHRPLENTIIDGRQLRDRIC